MPDFDNKLSDKIICPKCGWDKYPTCEVNEDRWDECEECGTEFDITIDVEVTYSTSVRGACILCEGAKEFNGKECPACAS